MFKSAEHAVATSMYMLSTPIYSKNGTQIVIEMLIDRFGRDGKDIVLSKTGLSPHDWRAQSVFIVNAIERTLGTNSPAYHIIIVEFGNTEAAETSAKKLLEIMGIKSETDIDAQFQIDCVLSIFRTKTYSVRSISDKYDLPKSNIHRLISAMRVILYGYRRAGYLRLEHSFRRLFIIDCGNEE